MNSLTDINILLDRSGSMDVIATDTIGGYNNFLAEQQADQRPARLTLVQFDSQGYDVVHEYQPLAQVPKLDHSRFQPRGGTPLFDSMARLIETTGTRLAAMPEDQRPDKVVVVIITDGLENASHLHTAEQVAAMVKTQSEQYGWLFLYLGANQDAVLAAKQIGIPMAHAASYAISTDGVKAAYGAVGQMTARARGGVSNFANVVTDSMREEMADDPKKKARAKAPSRA